jgi:hypothetical protein
VLVGGAAVSLRTDGAVLSGDFDVVIAAETDRNFEEAMALEGFHKENRSGRLLIGWYHPEYPDYGFQLVTGPLYDGRSDLGKLEKLDLEDNGVIWVASIEDLIADRLGQHKATSSPIFTDMMDQAIILKKLANVLDIPYLRKRVQDEQGDIDILGLEK